MPLSGGDSTHGDGAPPHGGGGGGPPSGGGTPSHYSHHSVHSHHDGNISRVGRLPTQGGGPPDGGPPEGAGVTGVKSPPPALPARFQQALSDHTDYAAVQRIGDFHFDRKLKPEIIPTWDGNGDTLGDWLISVGDLADRGPTVYTELGQIVPTRLRGDASTWFWSLHQQVRRSAMHSWGTLLQKICEFWMSRSWLDKQKVRANKATYREAGHEQESPVQYVIRKLKLLQLVYEYSDSQLIIEIMATAPRYWNQVIDPQRCVDMEDFLNGVKYNEDALASSYSGVDLSLEHRMKQMESTLQALQRPTRYRPQGARAPNLAF